MSFCIDRGVVSLFYPKGTSSLRSGRFFRKNEAKNRRGSRIAPLTRAFATTRHALRDLY